MNGRESSLALSLVPLRAQDKTAGPPSSGGRRRRSLLRRASQEAIMDEGKPVQKIKNPMCGGPLGGVYVIHAKKRIEKTPVDAPARTCTYFYI